MSFPFFSPLLFSLLLSCPCFFCLYYLSLCFDLSISVGLCLTVLVTALIKRTFLAFVPPFHAVRNGCRWLSLSSFISHTLIVLLPLSVSKPLSLSLLLVRQCCKVRPLCLACICLCMASHIARSLGLVSNLVVSLSLFGLTV